MFEMMILSLALGFIFIGILALWGTGKPEGKYQDYLNKIKLKKTNRKGIESEIEVGMYALNLIIFFVVIDIIWITYNIIKYSISYQMNIVAISLLIPLIFLVFVIWEGVTKYKNKLKDF